MSGPAIFARLVASLPCAAVAFVSAWRLIDGGNAWWLLGFLFAALLAPAMEYSVHERF